MRGRERTPNKDTKLTKNSVKKYLLKSSERRERERGVEGGRELQTKRDCPEHARPSVSETVMKAVCRQVELFGDDITGWRSLLFASKM